MRAPHNQRLDVAMRQRHACSLHMFMQTCPCLSCLLAHTVPSSILHNCLRAPLLVPVSLGFGQWAHALLLLRVLPCAGFPKSFVSFCTACLLLAPTDAPPAAAAAAATSCCLAASHPAAASHTELHAWSLECCLSQTTSLALGLQQRQDVACARGMCVLQCACKLGRVLWVVPGGARVRRWAAAVCMCSQPRCIHTST